MPGDERLRVQILDSPEQLESLCLDQCFRRWIDLLRLDRRIRGRV